MNRFFIAGAAMAIAGVFSAEALAQAQGPSPAAIARNCYLCHGPEGKTAGPMPRLNGQPAAAIGKALTDFKTDQRKGTIMNRIAKGYSDADLQAVAQYLGNLK
jgi:sulfide dehydrogenase cytochrome subunit